MRFIFFFSLLLLFSLCKESARDPLPQKMYYETLDIRKWHNEYLDFDSTLINGKIPLSTTKTELFRILGKPDETIPMPINIGNLYHFGKYRERDGDLLIYGNSIFEGHEEDVIIHTIDFENTDIELVNPKIILSKKLLPIDVQKIFPESGKLISGSGNSWSGYVMLHSSKPFSGGPIWFLTFRAERLSRAILYHVPVYE